MLKVCEVFGFKLYYEIQTKTFKLVEIHIYIKFI